MTGVGVPVPYLSLVSTENVSSRLSTDWLTGSVQTRPARPEWKTASTGTDSKTGGENYTAISKLVIIDFIFI